MVDFDKEKYLASIIDSADDAIIGKDLNGVILSWNKGAEKIYGYSSDEIIGKNITILTVPENEDEIKKILKKVSEGEKIGHYETTGKTKDGRRINISLIVSPIKDSRNNIVGASTIAHDITGLKKSEHLLTERIKELNAFYNISEIVEIKDITINLIYEELINILPKSWQYPEIAYGKIIVNEEEYKTNNYKETEWKINSPIKVNNLLVGKIEIGYLEKRPDSDEGPFMKEERLLLDSVAERLGKITERYALEGNLREKLIELNKMNHFMVDRELKMTELKKENEELKAKLENK
jgi:PAS domain S-box-containing protein